MLGVHGDKAADVPLNGADAVQVLPGDLDRRPLLAGHLVLQLAHHRPRRCGGPHAAAALLAA
jgi:hypothetical protein